MRPLIAALLLAAAPAIAQDVPQDFDCPPDIAADSPRCVPEAGLAAQVYSIGDVLDEDVPLDPADRENIPPLEEDEAFAVLGDQLLRVEIETRRIRDVLDIVPVE
ncbi:hypothetical protein [Jannaschia formosa]|uniref:hypothetical protein n=1 Tax=Jannaschia formosa TaxID=2259592 RepID=UPI000E1B7417|nr:hypothetical protein [Jannaschia formosa]TFL17431.1 hypothetical protein DR046_14585 [Jannaschia formosa]